MRNHYWTPTDFRAVKQASSYEELLAVALRVMKQTPQPLHQVCGPISTGGLGNLEANLKEFDRAIEYFSKHVNVFDQVPFEGPMQELKKQETKSLMQTFYKPLFTSGYIHKLLFLPGWETSTGAQTEMRWAKKYGIAYIQLPTDWDEHTTYLKK